MLMINSQVIFIKAGQRYLVYPETKCPVWYTVAMSLSSTKRAGTVWLLSGTFLLIYSILGLLHIKIPGAEDLVAFMSTTEGWYIYIAAFTAVLFEGLYLIGNFIPGTTLILVTAILASASGPLVFMGTILAIYIGWVLAGVINIFFMTRLFSRLSHTDSTEPAVHDHFFTTWYPAFRANHEVAQVASGIPRKKVFLSSLRVRTLASGAAALGALIAPHIIDIRTISNEEGFSTVFAVAIICLSVGLWQMYHHAKKQLA